MDVADQMQDVYRRLSETEKTIRDLVGEVGKINGTLPGVEQNIEEIKNVLINKKDNNNHTKNIYERVIFYLLAIMAGLLGAKINIPWWN